MNKQQLFTNLDKHLTNDEKPSEYMKTVFEDPVIKEYPFELLYKLSLTEQSKEHHPEGNVLNHTLLVIDEAAKVREKSKDKRAFMWAAFLHDIGKPSTTKERKGKITSYNHDKIGAKLAKDFLTYFEEEPQFIKQVTMLIFYHMQILFVVKNNGKADIEGMKKKADIDEIALLGLCDRLGRGKDNKSEEEENIRRFLRICKENGR